MCDDGYCDIDASDGSSCGSGSGPGDNCNFGEINRFFQTIMTRDVIEWWCSINSTRDRNITENWFKLFT